MLAWAKIFDQISKIQVKSITDAPFRNSLLFFLMGGAAAIFKAEAWVVITLFSVGGLVLLVALIVYLVFCFKNPDYLRSENYQIQKQSLELLGDKDNALTQIKAIKDITSPYNSFESDDNSNNKLGASDE